jgi:hypothetical protein
LLVAVVGRWVRRVLEVIVLLLELLAGVALLNLHLR